MILNWFHIPIAYNVCFINSCLWKFNFCVLFWLCHYVCKEPRFSLSYCPLLCMYYHKSFALNKNGAAINPPKAWKCTMYRAALCSDMKMMVWYREIENFRKTKERMKIRRIILFVRWVGVWGFFEGMGHTFCNVVSFLVGDLCMYRPYWSAL